MKSDAEHKSGTEKIILGGGCFWCIEAIFQTMPGVLYVKSGYAGGSVPNPTYKQVTSGQTGHAEVVLIEFDTEVTNLESVLELFWMAHDPTTLNRQGADVGTQYRSVIVLTDVSTQKPVVANSISEASKLFSNPIVTEVIDSAVFYEAEDYHQNFYRNNNLHPYCRAVISPKLQKLDAKKNK